MRLEQLADLLGVRWVGEGGTEIRDIASFEQAGDGALAFMADPCLVDALPASRAAAVIVRPEHEHRLPASGLIADDPYLCFARASQLIPMPQRASGGVHPSAVVDVELPSDVAVGAGSVIEQGARIGPGANIGAQCFIGSGAVIGRCSRLHPQVVVGAGCRLGDDVIVHSGVVIGADGFGFARDRDGHWEKIVHRGSVRIGNRVEIGANTTIDRGALDDTVIGDGVKLDNQIQIAHNVVIGEHTAIAGCVGIAGSTHIGARCMIGGQAGIIGHLRICDDVVISAGTLVTKSILRPGRYTANLPLQRHEDWARNFAHLRRLDEIATGRQTRGDTRPKREPK